MSAFGQLSSREPTDISDGRGLVGARFFGPELDVSCLEREVIPAIFSGKKPGNELRLWVMNCGSGQAAYSLALLLREANIDLRAQLRINIFATDTDANSLAMARIGRFDQTIERDVSAGRLERWFVAGDGSYTVGKELRSTCTFSIHDVAQDVPFSHMDLIYCGNVLRRLSPALQDKAAPLLHFSLRAGGYLLPLSADCMTRHANLFALAPGATEIYCRLDSGRRFFPAFPL